MKNMYQNLSTSLNKIMRCNGLVRSVWSQNVKRHESKKKYDRRMGDEIKKLKVEQGVLERSENYFFSSCWTDLRVSPVTDFCVGPVTESVVMTATKSSTIRRHNRPGNVMTVTVGYETE